MQFTQKVATPGKHMLKITMVDPTVVVQSTIIHDAPLPLVFWSAAQRAEWSGK
jgi:hypothetical protein